MSCAALAQWLEAELIGEGTREITDVASLDGAEATHLSFVDGAVALTAARSTGAGALLVRRRSVDEVKAKTPTQTLLAVDDPQAAFIRAMLLFRPQRSRHAPGISRDVWICPSARVGWETHIGPNAYVGQDAVIGDHCVIHPGVVIGAECVIGDNTVIHPNAVLYDGVRIGSRCVIHATAVIGADGFGFRYEEGRFVRIPHTGTVIIEDDVEVGAGTTIDRGMVGATVIGQGTKLDNQIQIAHNCRLGPHNAFAAQVGLAGSVTTGSHVRCAGQVGVADHVHLGSGCTLGGKAAASADVPKGEIYYGIPAAPAKEQARVVMTLPKVPEMRRTLLALEKKVEALEAELSRSRALKAA